MSTVAPFSTNWPSIPVPPYPVWRFTVAEYHRLLETGILGEDDDVELLEGWIVPKMTRSPAHDVAIELVDAALRAVLPAGWRVRIQSAITTSDSEPEPDLALVRGPIRSATGRHPEPREVGLAIEVSESSVETDRENKGRLYARAGVPYYWFVNLADSQVEVYSDPSGPVAPSGYGSCRVYLKGQMAPLVLDGQECGLLAINDLLP